MSRNYEPTTTLPGTEERIKVMQRRVAAKQPTDHPLDKTDSIDEAFVGHEAGNGVILRTNASVSLRHKAPEQKTIGQAIREIRKREGLSIIACASMAGINDDFLHRIELGKQGCRLPILFRITAALNTQIVIGSYVVTK